MHAMLNAHPSSRRRQAPSAFSTALRRHSGVLIAAALILVGGLLASLSCLGSSGAAGPENDPERQWLMATNRGPKTGDVRVLPAGYTDERACSVARKPSVAKPADKCADSEAACCIETESAEAASLARDKREEVKEMLHKLNIAGVHLIVMAGRRHSTEIVLRAARRMLSDRAGVASMVSILTTAAQEQFVEGIVEQLRFPSVTKHQVQGTHDYMVVNKDIAAGAPTNLDSQKTHFITLRQRHPRDFRDVYNVSLVDGFLHIKLDDDLMYVHDFFDVHLAWRYLTQRSATTAKNPHWCEESGPLVGKDGKHRCSVHGSVNTLGPKYDESVCTVLGANIVNHVGLGSVHSAMGALDGAFGPVKNNQGQHPNVPLLDTDFLTHQRPARWAAMHRHFLSILRRGRIPVSAFDFGHHRYDCDAQPRRWSINGFLFDIQRSTVAEQMPPDDEFFFSKMFHTHLVPAENRNFPTRVCAEGSALAVHGSYSFQYLHMAHFNDSTKPKDSANFEGRARFDDVMAELGEVYLAVAKHQDGSEKCCAITNCRVFHDGGRKPGESLRCPSSSTDCTFPFRSEERWFASMRNELATVRDDSGVPVRDRRYFLVPAADTGAALQLNFRRPPAPSGRRSPASSDGEIPDIASENQLEVAPETWTIQSKFVIETLESKANDRQVVLAQLRSVIVDKWVPVSVATVRIRSAFLQSHCLTAAQSGAGPDAENSAELEVSFQECGATNSSPKSAEQQLRWVAGSDGSAALIFGDIGHPAKWWCAMVADLGRDWRVILRRGPGACRISENNRFTLLDARRAKAVYGLQAEQQGDKL